LGNRHQRRRAASATKRKTIGRMKRSWTIAPDRGRWGRPLATERWESSLTPRMVGPASVRTACPRRITSRPETRS